ncbi:MAG TPA: reverse transcriptase-like protein, partial [Candidatus Hodarchaeales archaeon]|nr:reverse transcriptase-like protein [Candidatus Hodarchaeales archaeon]
ELALHITGDSELVIKQLKGEYRVRHPNIVPLYSKVQQKLEELRHYGLQNIVYQRIPRKENSEADTLANEAIDQATGL